MNMVEKVARALAEAELGYGMKLVRLVDGVSTYRLTYSDGEVLEFDNTDDLYLHVEGKKRLTQARAAIEAMKEPTTEMQQVVAAQWGRRTWAQYEEVIVAAIGGDENA